MDSLRIATEQASTTAASVDALFWALVAISAFFAGLIFLLLTIFLIKYRRQRTGARIGEPPATDKHGGAETGIPQVRSWAFALEIAWTAIPLGIAMVLFVWGAWLYYQTSTPPGSALDVYVVGKQWMWKFQHPEGQREINELHVPLAQPIRLTMTSEDVIHSFFVPAFRMKMDVVPGRYTRTWFQATKTGRFLIECTQYCGTEHSHMTGAVIVLDPPEYERWLQASAGPPSLADAGGALIERLGCTSCHPPGGGGRGPGLNGLYNHPVQLTDGSTVVADESYLRESILNPQVKIAAGYPPIMPTYQGRLSEEEMVQILAYIKSLAGEPARTKR